MLVLVLHLVNRKKAVQSLVYQVIEKSCTKIRVLILSSSQGVQLIHLLINFSDVFAKEDSDLDIFSAIEHTIDTGEANTE